MVENQRKLYRFPRLDNANFWPSKIKFILVIWWFDSFEFWIWKFQEFQKTLFYFLKLGESVLIQEFHWKKSLKVSHLAAELCVIFVTLRVLSFAKNSRTEIHPHQLTYAFSSWSRHCIFYAWYLIIYLIWENFLMSEERSKK